jgi:hypothetical protein
VAAHGKKKKRFGGKVRKQECSSLKTALHKTYKKIYYREGLTSQMRSCRRWLFMVVKSQSITMAEKRLKEPFMSGRLLSLFNQQPLTVKVRVLKKTILEEQQRKSELAAAKKLDMKDTLITR